jgi:hypothetical protein
MKIITTFFFIKKKNNEKIRIHKKMQDYSKLQVHTCLFKKTHEKLYEGYNYDKIRLDNI